ncbi:MAG: carboxypeptidase-like regulatory domain-containing protein, partial [Bacteroidota bacterium]|nr:carboxypeptidase-like regulatory domain-containing protein [Bacteroidota bacterium]
MTRVYSCIILVMLFGITKNSVSQTNLIQFSGVVISQDSLQPVPYCSIIDKKTKRGTTSDYFGYFSFVANKGDTINFSCIGYKKTSFVIPDTLTTNKYSLIQVLFQDTILLKTAVV